MNAVVVMLVPGRQTVWTRGDWKGERGDVLDCWSDGEVRMLVVAERWGKSWVQVDEEVEEAVVVEEVEEDGETGEVEEEYVIGIVLHVSMSVSVSISGGEGR